MPSQNAREYFYKYYSVQTAKLVLENGSRKWSSPLEFNDPFDMQFDLFAEADLDTSARAMAETLLHRPMSGQPVTAPQGSGSHAAGMLEKFRTILSAENITFTAKMKDQSLVAAREAVQRFNTNRDQYNEELRMLFQDYSIFCVSETNDNVLMWAHYSRNHTGAVIKFVNLHEVDSPLLLAQKVRYSLEMPRIGPEDIAKFIVSPQVIMERLALTKSTAWVYEQEWRVVSPNPPQISPFKDAELGAIYLGCKMSVEDKREMIEISSRKYPKAEIYQARKEKATFALVFDRIQ